MFVLTLGVEAIIIIIIIIITTTIARARARTRMMVMVTEIKQLKYNESLNRMNPQC